MSLDKIHLRKLLRILYAPPKLRKTLLRSDIRETIKKENGEKEPGGDFFGPFWADVRLFVFEDQDLRKLCQARIEANKGRDRLYRELCEGISKWWNERRRWRNEPKPFDEVEEDIKARLLFEELGLTVKVENVLGVKINDRTRRFIYPYFSEAPTLTQDAARLGLWLLNQALPAYPANDWRVLDILRSRSFGLEDVPLTGNERERFSAMYRAAMKEWSDLRDEYD